MAIGLGIWGPFVCIVQSDRICSPFACSVFFSRAVKSSHNPSDLSSSANNTSHSHTHGECHRALAALARPVSGLETTPPGVSVLVVVARFCLRRLMRPDDKCARVLHERAHLWSHHVHCKCLHTASHLMRAPRASSRRLRLRMCMPIAVATKYYHAPLCYQLPDSPRKHSSA